MSQNNQNKNKCKNNYNIFAILGGICFTVITFNAAVGDAWAFRGFARPCKDIQINGAVLTASCKRHDGTFKTSRINLNPYIGNFNGKLKWDGQDFIKTCYDISLSGNSILSAKCQTTAQFHITSFIDLEDSISNMDGNLRFHP
jgi:hypothetical protein